MDEEEERPREPAEHDWVGSASFATQAHAEREYPELSAAEFHRFLSAANESCPGHNAHGRCRAAITTRALLALALIGLTGLMLLLLLATGREGEATLHAAEMSRLQREVCQAAMRFPQHQRESFESVCEAHP